MESIGDLLKAAREKEGVSVEQVERETHISKKYLEALENEEFSIFPGEPYLRGFLRTYCLYLKLEPDEIIRKYERIKIAETPTPIEKLIPKPKPDFKKLIIFSSAGLIAIIFFITLIMLINNISKGKKDNSVVKNEAKNSEISQNISYQMSSLEKVKVLNLNKGDNIEFEFNQKKYIFNLKELNPVVKLNDPNNNEIFLVKGYQKKIDLDNDQISDVTVILNNWDNKTANITIGFGDILNQGVDEQKIASGENLETIVKKQIIEKIDFSINIKESTFLRYKLDQQDEVEVYYKDPTTKNFSANERIIIWASNSGIVGINFPQYNKQVTLGKVGQVIVKLIQWTKSSSGEYELQMSSLN